MEDLADDGDVQADGGGVSPGDLELAQGWGRSERGGGRGEGAGVRGGGVGGAADEFWECGLFDEADGEAVGLEEGSVVAFDVLVRE